jgi:hypothetical protein
MKYTKGPWTIWLTPEGKTYILGDDTKQVAEVYGAPIHDNCFLIKAAPEMFEALATIQRLAEGQKINGIASIARNALEKAKGGTK